MNFGGIIHLVQGASIEKNLLNRSTTEFCKGLESKDA